MGKMQRNKGARVERELVNKLREHGIKANRVPLSGAVDGYEGDIELSNGKKCEVKARANGQGFTVIERWLKGNDYLFLKRDRKEPLVVMHWDEFIDLINR